MSEISDFSAALGVSVNVPVVALGPAESRKVLDHCTSVLTGVACHFEGKVLDAAGGNLSIVFAAAHQAMQAAQTMNKRIGEMPPVAGENISIGIGAATSLGKAMALMLSASAGQVIVDKELEALLQPDTIAPEIFPGKDEIAQAAVQTSPPPAETSSPEAEPTPAPAAKSRLLLTHDGKTVVVDDQNREVKIGRGPECALQINDPWASRIHVTVLKQGNRFVLLDSSTNGTYYALADDIEARVHKRTLTLGEKGSFSLGRQAAQALGGAIHYEQE